MIERSHILFLVNIYSLSNPLNKYLPVTKLKNNDPKLKMSDF